MKKEELLALLRENVVTVTFTKVSGETRVMPCTLSEQIIPAEFAPKGTGKQKPDTSDLISAFCTDAQGWRSFKFSNVTAVEVSV